MLDKYATKIRFPLRCENMYSKQQLSSAKKLLKIMKFVLIINLNLRL